MKKLAIALVFTLLLGIVPAFASSSAQNDNMAPRRGRRHHRRHHRRNRRRHHRRARMHGNTNS